MTSQEQLPVRAAVFDTVDMADRAVQGLVDAGFDSDAITLVCSDRAKKRFFPDIETRSPAGKTAPAKAAGGGALGALVGGLTSVAVATGGGIPLVAAGGVLVLIGAGAGSFVGAMTSRGVEPEIADYYDQALEDGKILVTVSADGDVAAAEKVFEDLGQSPAGLREE